MRKLYVVGRDGGYSDPWRPLFDLVYNIEESDVVMLTGGADIGPHLYGEKNYGHSYTNPTRDKREVEAYDWCIANQKPMLGICRGAQLICALSGGRLYQHVDNHAGRAHLCELSDGRRMMFSSAHHQMMRPAGDYELLAWTPSQSRRYMSNEGTAKQHELGRDPEVVFYPGIKSLAIQSHPEYLKIDAESNIYLRDLVKARLLSEV